MKNSILKQVQYRNLFIVLSLGIFVIFGSILYAFNLLPNELSNHNNVINKEEELLPLAIYEKDVFPNRIVIDSVGINTVVNRPQSQNVEVLDQALTIGAVYYPGSGSLVKGNAFIFGHSTSLSVVRNQAYKAFNNLKSVKVGDMIKVYGDDGNTYIYSAISTELVIEDTAIVEFDTDGRMITLSTCNTFGKKEERYVVKALFVGVKGDL